MTKKTIFGKSKANVKGSLLTEALLSVVILSVSITFIIQSMIGSLRVLNYGKYYTQALIHGENKMFDYVSQEGIRPNFYEEGALDTDNGEFDFTMEAQDLPDRDEEDINDVKLTISWANKGKISRLMLRTYEPTIEE